MEVRTMTILIALVLLAAIFALMHVEGKLRRELHELKMECETMFHRDRKTGRIAKGRRKD
jgi:hypothetical protein